MNRMRIPFSENEFMFGVTLGELTGKSDAKEVETLIFDFLKEHNAVVLRFTASYKMLLVYPKDAPELKHSFKVSITKDTPPSCVNGYWFGYIGSISDYLGIPFSIKRNYVEIYEYK